MNRANCFHIVMSMMAGALMARQALCQTCKAYPQTLLPGDSASIVCSCTSVSGWNASAGTINGAGTMATFSSTGAPSGTVRVTASCRGTHPGAKVVFVTIALPPAPAVPHSKSLCSIVFSSQTDRLTRIPSERIACLDDVALNLQMTSDSDLAIVGDAPPDTLNGVEVARTGVIRVRDYLANEKKINKSRISLWIGSGTANEVHFFLIPAGANFITDIPDVKPLHVPN